MSERDEIMWCPRCGGRYTYEETTAVGATACPGCNDEGTPCDTALDLTVEINWHELRILGIWAENWANHIKSKEDSRGFNKRAPQLIESITRRLQRQYPDLTPLTLSGELASLPKALADAGIEAGVIEHNLAKPSMLVTNGPGAVGHSKKNG